MEDSFWMQVLGWLEHNQKPRGENTSGFFNVNGSSESDLLFFLVLMSIMIFFGNS